MLCPASVEYAKAALPNHVVALSTKNEAEFMAKPTPKVRRLVYSFATRNAHTALLSQAILFTKATVTSALYKALSFQFEGRMALGEAVKGKVKKLEVRRWFMCSLRLMRSPRPRAHRRSSACRSSLAWSSSLRALRAPRRVRFPHILTGVYRR